MLRRLIAGLLILSLVLPLPAHAGMVATESLLERERIATLLERADVQAQLEAYGVSPGEVKARVAALT
ncbi:MAG TPA: PA2779 family protein, partial [Burkholderiales bacterium]|nr:PA2779 family protein [Burkholderiales bacterium]